MLWLESTVVFYHRELRFWTCVNLVILLLVCFARNADGFVWMWSCYLLALVVGVVICSVATAGATAYDFPIKTMIYLGDSGAFGALIGYVIILMKRQKRVEQFRG